MYIQIYACIYTQTIRSSVVQVKKLVCRRTFRGKGKLPFNHVCTTRKTQLSNGIKRSFPSHWKISRPTQTETALFLVQPFSHGILSYACKHTWMFHQSIHYARVYLHVCRHILHVSICACITYGRTFESLLTRLSIGSICTLHYITHTHTHTCAGVVRLKPWGLWAMRTQSHEDSEPWFLFVSYIRSNAEKLWGIYVVYVREIVAYVWEIPCLAHAFERSNMLRLACFMGGSRGRYISHHCVACCAFRHLQTFRHVRWAAIWIYHDYGCTTSYVWFWFQPSRVKNPWFGEVMPFHHVLPRMMW